MIFYPWWTWLSTIIQHSLPLGPFFPWFLDFSPSFSLKFSVDWVSFVDSNRSLNISVSMIYPMISSLLTLYSLQVVYPHLWFQQPTINQWYQIKFSNLGFSELLTFISKNLFFPFRYLKSMFQLNLVKLNCN